MPLKSNRSFLVVFAIAMLAFFLAGIGSNAAEAQTTSEIDEQGRGTTDQTSDEGCQFGGQCTDEIEGLLVGDPITNRDAEGEGAGITGELTADYAQADIDETRDTFVVPVEGDVTLTDDDGSTLELAIEGEYRGTLSGNTATLVGDFEITGGTGEFEGATGSGTVRARVQDNGETGTFAARLAGTLTLPEEEPIPGPPGPPGASGPTGQQGPPGASGSTNVILQTKKAKKDRKNCSKLENKARKNCQQNKNGNGNGNG